MPSSFPFSVPLPILFLLYLAHNHGYASHALHVNLYPHAHTTNLISPTTIVTVHRNNTSTASLTLHISPRDPFEALASINHTLSPPSTITFLPTLAPRITLPAILTFPLIDTTNFTITVRTTNPIYIYRASFRAIIAGIAIAQHRTQLSPSAGRGVSLGTYRTWVSTPQLALPLLLQPPFQSAPLNLHVRLTTLSGAEPTTTTLIDAVDPGTCTIPIPSDLPTPPKTMFYQRHSRISASLVAFPPACGLALSEDFNWLLIRFNPYRVAQYGFGLLMEWRGPSSPPHISNFFPMQTFVRFMFDPVLPPVIMGAFTAVIDPFGGELLEIAVENVSSPPHMRELGPQDFRLRLQVTAPRQVVTVLTPERVDRVSGALFRRVLRFRTKPLRADAQPVTYVLLAGNEEKIPGVVHPDETVDISLASDELAALDSCSQNETVYKDGFLLLEIGMFYNQSAFTQFKSDQIKQHIRLFFPWLPINGLRLVEIETGWIRFAVLLVNAVNNNSLALQTDELADAIVNGSFARAINVWENDITSHGIGNIQKTLCEVFPHLLLSSTSGVEMNGIQLRLLFLWVFLAIAASFITAVLISLTVLGKKNNFKERGAAGSDHMDSTPETNARSSLHSYPSEAREAFARRYHVNGTITPENVRDSDLASTVLLDSEPGIAGLVSFAMQLGREMGQGLGRNWSKLRVNGSQSRSTTPQTPPDSESPPIYIEHVLHSAPEVLR